MKRRSWPYICAILLVAGARLACVPESQPTASSQSSILPAAAVPSLGPDTKEATTGTVEEFASTAIDESLERESLEPVKDGKPVTITGRIVEVLNGDTVVLDDLRVRRKLRLKGIDAPDSPQPYASESRAALADLILDQFVRVDYSSLDRYDRILGDVYVGNRWINRALVEQGAACHFAEFDSRVSLRQADAKARSSRTGLWAVEGACTPTEYRARQKQEVLARREREGAAKQLARIAAEAERSHEVSKAAYVANEKGTSPADQTVYVTRTGAKYHIAGCRHLRKSSIAMPLSEAQKQYSACSVCNPP